MSGHGKATVAATLLAVGLAGFWLARRLHAQEQPIPYNHKKHVEAGLDCATCHTGIAEKKARAGIPNVELCITCHGQEDNPKTQAIRDYAAKKLPIPWRLIHSVPAHVYFSHQRHVAIAGMDCVICHGDMPNKTTPVTEQAVPISMGRCIDCHKKKGVTTDCLACHR